MCHGVCTNQQVGRKISPASDEGRNVISILQHTVLSKVCSKTESNIFYYIVKLQELNLREDELNKLINQQKAQEQELQRREAQLRIRELDLIEREIDVMI